MRGIIAIMGTDSFSSTSNFGAQWPSNYEENSEDPWTQLEELGLLNDTHLINFNFLDFNSSDKKELFDLQCKSKHKNDDFVLKLGEGNFCNASSDSIMCWPPMPVNSTAYLKCFSQFLGIKYDDTRKLFDICFLLF